MVILITGGAGYVGTELVKKLVLKEEVSEIIIYDNLSRGDYNFFISGKYKNKKIQFIQGDLLDSRMVKKVVGRADVVYHLAAVMPGPYSEMDPHLLEQTNHWGTAELSYALEGAKQVKKVIHLSSIGVYGYSGKMEVTENSPLNPRTNYDISKMRGEAFMMQLPDTIDFFICRSANVYGFSPSMRFDAVINRFAFESNFAKRISIHGNGQQVRSFIHIDRLTDIIAEMPFGKVPSGTYNLVDINKTVMDIALTYKDIIPEMEMIFINQHLKLRDLSVSPVGKIYQYFPKKGIDFKAELRELIGHFAF